MRISVAVDAYSAEALPEELPARVRNTQRKHAKTFVREEAASLAAAGLEVELLVPLPERVGLLGLFPKRHNAKVVTRACDDKLTERFASWPCHPLLRRAPLALLAVRREARALGLLLDAASAAGAFDLLHAHFALPTGCAAARVATARGLPHLVTVHETQLEATARWPHLRRAIERALSAAARVVCVSGPLREKLCGYFPRLAERTVVLPNGVDAARFRPRDGVEAPGGGPRLLSVGHLIPRKGHDLVLRAAAMLRKDLPDLRVSIAGEGEEEPALRALVARLGLAGNVRFMGALDRDAVARAMREEGDLLVLASRRETFGIVVIEALSSGLPVVATRCGGPEAILTDAVGRLVPVEDAGALARAIHEVWEKRADFSPARLSSFARERYASERVAARLIALYEEVLRERG